MVNALILYEIGRFLCLWAAYSPWNMLHLLFTLSIENLRSNRNTCENQITHIQYCVPREKSKPQPPPLLRMSLIPSELRIRKDLLKCIKCCAGREEGKSTHCAWFYRAFKISRTILDKETTTSKGPILFNFPMLMQLGQWGIYGILHWGDNNVDLLKVREFLFPCFRAALWLKTWIGLGHKSSIIFLSTVASQIPAPSVLWNINDQWQHTR